MNQKIHTHKPLASSAGPSGVSHKASGRKRLLVATETRADVLKRFWSKVEILGPDDCWEWQYTLDCAARTDTYGLFYQAQFRPMKQRAPRWIYGMIHGQLPRSMFACHTCDNRRCVNPKHIFPATHLENVRDMDLKGRRRRLMCYAPRSLVHFVHEIRALHAAGARIQSLSEKFRAHYNSIWSIVRRKTYTNL